MTGLLGAYPSNRDGSGTSWQPDSSPMEGLEVSENNLHLMVHGDAG
jgi:hypothetical protein